MSAPPDACVAPGRDRPRHRPDVLETPSSSAGSLLLAILSANNRTDLMARKPLKAASRGLTDRPCTPVRTSVFKLCSEPATASGLRRGGGRGPGGGARPSLAARSHQRMTVPTPDGAASNAITPHLRFRRPSSVDRAVRVRRRPAAHRPPATGAGAVPLSPTARPSPRPCLNAAPCPWRSAL
jgi:hypothetical protein